MKKILLILAVIVGIVVLVWLLFKAECVKRAGCPEQ